MNRAYPMPILMQGQDVLAQPGLNPQPLVDLIKIAEVMVGVEAGFNLCRREMSLDSLVVGDELMEVAIVGIPGRMGAGLNHGIGFFPG